MNPKGYLVSVGGAEDKGTDLEKGIIDRNRLSFFEIGILKNIVSLSNKKEPIVEVITTASMIPMEVFENYFDAFSKLDCHKVGHINIRNREDSNKKEYLERVSNCDIIMFSGGNQLRLSSIFGGTQFLSIIKERYLNEPFVIAGTSAGAMAMSNTMIYEGTASKAHLKGEVKITTGLGFLNGVVIDSHFDKRGRFNRLAQAVAAQPGALGIGLGEDTGVIVSDGNQLEVIGSGSIILIDGRNVEYNNIADISAGQPISIENLIVHILSDGDKFEIMSRTYTGKRIIVEDDDV